jgi:heme exporter protein B
MTSPGFFTATRVVLGKDLKLEWRTWETLSSSLVFSLIVIVIYSFAFGFGSVQELGAGRLLPGMIWTVVAFASVVGMVRSFQLERRRDTLGALFLAPIDRGAIYLGKMSANLIKLTVVQWALLPLIAVFFNHDMTGVVLPLMGVLFLHGLGLAELGTLFAAISTRLGRGEALLATLLFPAVSPLLISAVKTTEACLDGRGLGAVSNWLMVTAGFDLLYLMVGMLTFEFVLEE